MDWTMDWYDWIRVATALTSLAAMYYLARSWRLRSNDYTNRLKDFWWATNALLFCALAGSIEQIIRNREETWTLIILFFAALVSLKAAMNKNTDLIRSDPHVAGDDQKPHTGPLRFFLDTGKFFDRSQQR